MEKKQQMPLFYYCIQTYINIFITTKNNVCVSTANRNTKEQSIYSINISIYNTSDIYIYINTQKYKLVTIDKEKKII